MNDESNVMKGSFVRIGKLEEKKIDFDDWIRNPFVPCITMQKMKKKKK